MTDSELVSALERLRSLMISVATGGPRIEKVNSDYLSLHTEIDEALRERGIKNLNTYADLWEWYGRWSGGDLPSYQSRRTFISEIFTPLIAQVRTAATGIRPIESEPTGWAKVDRTLDEIRRRLAEAVLEEQFQAVGLLCREALISLAEAVYIPAKHPSIDGKTPSSTDAKRRLEAYFAAEFAGGANDEARKHARAAVDLAVQLQHRRTAGFRQAALCAEATASVINVVAIVSGKRDPR